jgi:hypothetical protein
LKSRKRFLYLKGTKREKKKMLNPVELELDETTQVTVMEIARMVLAGDLGETVFDQTLDRLDMTLDEADKVWLKLEQALNA